MEAHLTPPPHSSILNSSDETLASSSSPDPDSPLSDKIFSDDDDNDPSSDSDGFPEPPREYGLGYGYGYCSSHWTSSWACESSVSSTWQAYSSGSSGGGMVEEEEGRAVASEEDIDWDDPSADLEVKPLFADAIDEQELSPGPYHMGAGFANLGNTCFMNVILQCFAHTVPLLQGILDTIPAHKAYCEGFFRGFCVFCNLYELIEYSLGSGERVLSPTKFVCNLNYFSSSFRRFQQEDAHEFLQCFLDKLESFDLTLAESDNLVKKVFGGRFVSKLKCCKCGHCSDTYEPMIDLSLEIGEVSDLLAALDSFTKIEEIEDTFTCEGCKEKVSVEKQLLLDQAPPVATFHLKRFKNDGSFVEKIDNHVAFPLELDLLPYTRNKQSDKMKYDLYAVVVHTGFSSTSGHYYCFIRRSPGEWYRCDDSKITYVHQDYVLNQEAYILFYVKEGTPTFQDFINSNRQHMDPSLLHTSPKSVLDSVDIRTRSPNMPVTCRIDAIETSDVATACTGSRSGSRDKEVTLSEEIDCRGVDGSDKKGREETLPEGMGVDGSVKKDEEETLPGGMDCRGDGVDNKGDPASDPPLASNNTVNVASSDDKGSIPVTAANTVTLPTREVPQSSSPPVLKRNKFAEFEFGNDLPTSPATPRSPSPEIYREDPPNNTFSIPRDHLRVVEPNSCKRELNKELQDVGRKQACSFVKKNVHGSRGKQLMAAIYGPQSKGSDNKKRARETRTTSPNHEDRGSATRRRGGVPVLASSLR